MEKKATLLIKNLHKIYTMDEELSRSSFLTNAFVAIHHEEILDMGVHDYQKHIDKDTRIIDGKNHIAIPAFIEVNAYMSKRVQHSVREQNEYFMRFMHNGTLTIHTNTSVREELQNNYHYELLQHQKCQKMLLVNTLQQMKSTKSIDFHVPFCISTYDQEVSLQNQMLAAQMLAMKEGISAEKLLKALTIYPAAYLQLPTYGKIKKGYIANILVLSCVDIQAFFYSLDQNQIAHCIHKGVRIFPNLLI